MKKVKILNVQFDVCTKDEALARIFNFLSQRTSEPGRQIATPNPEMLLAAEKNQEFQDVLNRTFLNVPDGAGILWAGAFQESSKRNGRFFRLLKGIWGLFSLLIYPRWCRKVFPERVSGVDLMESICALSARQNVPIFLLGAEPGIAESTKAVLERRYPGLRIVGSFSGTPNEDDFPAIQALIAETRPAILFVAYGAPRQELWISRHLKDLTSVRISMGVGGAFDFISGHRKRAPKYLQKLGLEWLYRLAQEPKRIKRIWNAVIRFPLAVLKK